MNKATKTINAIKVALGMEVQLAQMKLDDIRSQMFDIKDVSSPKYLNLKKEQEAIAKFAYPNQMAVAPSDGD